MKKLFSLFGMWFIFVIIAQVLFVWAGGSAITSGIKAMSQACGEQYLVEKVFAGDWFCPVKE